MAIPTPHDGVKKLSAQGLAPTSVPSVLPTLIIWKPAEPMWKTRERKIRAQGTRPQQKAPWDRATTVWVPTRSQTVPHMFAITQAPVSHAPSFQEATGWWGR